VLPDEEEIARRRAAGEGLSRPEVASLLAWSKISVRESLLASGLPDDPAVQAMLNAYFPPQVRTAVLIKQHPLARQIAGTVLANDIVNQAGPGFFCRLQERTGALLPDAAAAFTVAREVLGLGQLWADVDAGTVTTPTEGRLVALSMVQRALEEAAGWLLRNRPSPLTISEEIQVLAERVDRAWDAVRVGSGEDFRVRVELEAQHLVEHGIAEELADRVAQTALACSALDVSELADASPGSLDRVVTVYHEVGAVLGVEWLRQRVTIAASDPHWVQLAKAALIDDLGAQVRTITREALQTTPAIVAPGCVAQWLAARPESVRRLNAVLGELRAAPEVDLARLTVATQHVRALSTSDAADPLTPPAA
jgi:glutamate dehydrogenase